MMSRPVLLLCQLLVAVVFFGLWQFFATVPIFGYMVLPPFFFSTPVDVFNRIVKWLVEGSIWRHLMITLTEAVAGLRDRLGVRHADRVLVRPPANASPRSSIPMSR